MSEAEDVVRSTINGIREKQDIHQSPDQHHCHQHALNSDDDDEYQLQLAMALSLSTLDCADAGASDAIQERESVKYGNGSQSMRSPKDKDIAHQDNNNDMNIEDDKSSLIDTDEERLE
jgi:hypothetical protein